ncbi:hypothetical protein O8C22_23760, partial [Agrobacterium rhizogenes]|nr:hypothetical protein [Rhizobium rhizogenes]
PYIRHELIPALNSSLISQRYSPVVVRNYCTYAPGFLDYLGQRGILVADVIDVQVLLYLHVDHVCDQDAPLSQIIEKSRCVGAVIPHHDRAVSLTDKGGIECGN